MKQRQWLQGALWLWISALAGCGTPAPGGINDPNSFAGMNAAAIRTDCAQFRMCEGLTNAMLPADYVSKCVNGEVDTLSKHPEYQAAFLNRVNRCGVFPDACTYRDCIKSNMPVQPGYGESQAAKIMYGCQQKIQCESEHGKKFSDPTLAVNNCVGMTEGLFFRLGAAEQQTYENTFATCSALAGCAFVQCPYPY
jgi:hypothetical protein